MPDPQTRHSYNAKTYLDWMLEYYAGYYSIEVRTQLEDFFRRGMMWGAGKLEPEKQFYQWLELKAEQENHGQDSKSLAS